MTETVRHSTDAESVSETALAWLADDGPSRVGADTAQWTEANWSKLRRVLAIQGIGPLVCRALENTPEAWDALPPEVRVALVAARELNARRVARILREAEAILEAFRTAGVAALPLKGVLLAPRYYEAPQLRPMADIDLLVRPSDEPSALSSMEGLGYRLLKQTPKHAKFLHPEDDLDRIRPGEHPDNPRPVEIHTVVGEDILGRKHDVTATYWVGCREVDAGLEPAAPVLMRHILLHTAGLVLRGRMRALHLCDIAMLAERLAPEDWQGIEDEARATDAEKALYTPLALATRWASASVPGAALDRLRAGSPPRLAAFLGCVPWSHLTLCARPRRRFAALSGLMGRWTGSAAEWCAAAKHLAARARDRLR